MSEENTSSAGSATPTADQPATGTPTSSGATPLPKSTPALEDVLRENDELKRSQMNAKEELERHRKKLSAYEKAEKEAETARQAAKDAELGELERERKQRTAAEARIQQLQQENIVEKVINAAHKKGIIDPDLAALAILQDKSLLDEHGMPTDIDKALDTLIKNKPYLVPQKPAEPATTPAQTATPPAAQTPAIPAMNPGRSSIPGPGNNPNGKPTTLAELNWKR